MRDDVGDLLELTYVVSSFPSEGSTAFLTWCVGRGVEDTTIVFRYCRFQWDQQVFLLPRPSLSRTYGLEAWNVDVGRNGATCVRENEWDCVGKGVDKHARVPRCKYMWFYREICVYVSMNGRH